VNALVREPCQQGPVRAERDFLPACEARF
jgi:hypothetical protein